MKRNARHHTAGRAQQPTRARAATLPTAGAVVPAPRPERSPLDAPRRYALLSVGAALVTIALKTGAYLLTGSVGLLSDAVESLVNLVAALVAVGMLTLALRPPDADHAYGHTKAEYFASAIEGLLILLAAAGIGVTAWERLQHPQPIAQVELGLAISCAAAAVNGVVALTLLRAGRRLRAITLVADAQHLLTDVWTSGGVVVGVVLVKLTGWLALDPLIALLVAANIVWAGVRLLRDTARGVLDTALPPDDQARIAAILEPYRDAGIVFHALRTRVAGQRRFVSLHVLVPGAWTIQRGHALAEQIERAIGAALPQTTVFTHLEPVEDPISWEDQTLDRAVD
jgi:cation diffusion facilitator family transporter